MKALLALFAALVFGAAALAQPVRTPHVTTELVSETIGVAPGSTAYVAVILAADKGWHTYWRNPGDAGEATKISWTTPAGWKAGDIVWPAPSRLPVGPIMNYGFDGRAVLAVPIEVPASAQTGQNAQLAARVDYLVCAQVCVPGTSNVSLVLPVVAGTPPLDPRAGKTVAGALSAAPKPAGLVTAFHSAGGKFRLAAVGAPLAGAADADAYFYPYDDSLIDQAKPQAVDRGPQGLTLTLTPGAAYAAGKASPAKIAGVLAVDGGAWEVDANQGPLPAAAGGLGPPEASGGGGLRLPLAIGFAFLGGLILNLMPCVFPILAMKAAALARSAGQTGRREGIAFFAGVIVTFTLLAGLLIAARTAGQGLGWGFQLQSPLTVALLSLVMLGAALNFSGVYEIGASLQGLGAGIESQGQVVGSVLTGALAVVVAAPCTAPFMGPALGFALTQPPATAISVFLALAAGFAAPFTVLSFSPALTRRLPKPGAWMDGLRKALAFPMYGAAAWLLWVLSQQTGPMGLARLLTAGVALGACAWLFGVGQRRRISGGRSASPLLSSAACLILALAAVGFGPFDTEARAGQPATKKTGELTAQPWSPERLASLRAAGTPVLVNFTAAWCVTCQANEQVAFSSAEVGSAMKRAGAVYLVADWTNRDPVIAKAIADQGRESVPLYLFYAKGAAQPKVLPQLLTPDMVASAVTNGGAS
ncbi:MAG TPA: protein-disulfide reductase DsbD domain-containing protein [Caulobacteraceae bacterium]|nr:protein-disulfide reductase DsbD domain-containing protein [Caulobacteraceae bacterium]